MAAAATLVNRAAVFKTLCLFEAPDAATGVAEPGFMDAFDEAQALAASGHRDAAIACLDDAPGVAGQRSLMAADFRAALAQHRLIQDPRRPLVEDRPGCDVLRSPRGDAAITVLVFLGLAHRTSIDLRLLDRLFAGLGLSAIYLRDFHQILFGRGIRSMGDLETSLRGLGEMLKSFTDDDVVTVGLSGAGLAAIQYGTRLGVRRILNLAGPTCATGDFIAKIGDKRARILQKRLLQEVPADYLDTRPAVQSARSTSLHQFYSDTDAFVDGDHCRYLEDLPNVRNHPLAGCQTHSVIFRLLRDGVFLPTIRGETGD